MSNQNLNINNIIKEVDLNKVTFVPRRKGLSTVIAEQIISTFLNSNAQVKAVTIEANNKRTIDTIARKIRVIALERGLEVNAKVRRAIYEGKEIKIILITREKPKIRVRKKKVTETKKKKKPKNQNK